MATTSWPLALPQSPQVDKTSGGPQSNRVAFFPEAGDPIIRRRGSSVGHIYTFSFFPLTQEQTRIFAEWFEEELYDGVQAFDMPDPRTYEIYEWVFAEGDQSYEITYGEGELATLVIKLFRKG